MEIEAPPFPAASEVPDEPRGVAFLPVPPKAGLDLAGLLILRMEAQLALRPDAPAEGRDPLRALVRQLLQGLEAPAPLRYAQVPLAVPRSPQPQASSPAQAAQAAPAENTRPSEAGPSLGTARPQSTVPPPPDLPQSWEAWVGGAMKALGDPQVSPREAPFHLAQAKEGTAFFEVPLPWGPAGSALQIWVESGLPEGEEGASQEENHRVMVGLSFTALGETRIGLQKGRNTLQVRIWAEHPELLKDRVPEMKRELDDGERAVDLRILPLGDGQTPAPSLRSVALGSGYQALG